MENHTLPGESRFERPWRWPPLSCLPTLQQSNHRILYTPLREKVHDGVGHVLSQTAVEIGTALRLGITYVHRPLLADTLTRDQPEALEEFFALGEGALTREEVWKSACANPGEPYPPRNACVPCRALHVHKGRGSEARNRTAAIRRIVDVPLGLSFRFRDEDARHHRLATRFRLRHGRPHTLFRLSDVYCRGRNHFWRVFTGPVRSVLFHRFWWASAERGLEDGETTALRQDAIAVAVHVRRGDLLWDRITYRRMVPLPVLARVVGRIRCVAWREGGNVGKLALVAYMYSEGRVAESGDNRTAHDLTRMDKVLVDSDGSAVSERDMTAMLREAVNAYCGSAGLEGRWVVESVRAELRVARDTLRSIREMASSDVFVGTPSSLSTSVVEAIARGVRVQPGGKDEAGADGMRVMYDESDGGVDDGRLGRAWRDYVVANEESMLHAAGNEVK